MEEQDRKGAPLPPARVIGWTLAGGLAGAVAAPFLLSVWSEASGAGQDLGFLRLLLDYALAGGAAGSVAGLLFGLARRVAVVEQEPTA